MNRKKLIVDDWAKETDFVIAFESIDTILRQHFLYFWIFDI